LHSIADIRCFGHSTLAVHYAELRSFAAEISQTVENDRENFSIASPALLVPRPTASVIASADCR
jgi:hypothetical protein